MELATFSNLTKCAVLGIVLAVGVGGCATYDQAVSPYVEQYANEGCKDKAKWTVPVCQRLRTEMQHVYDRYHGGGGGGTGSQTGYIYIMN